MITDQLVLVTGTAVVLVILLAIKILIDVQSTMRNALVSLEEKVILTEDEARRLRADAHNLKKLLDNKVDATTLKRRLDGFAALLGVTHRR